MSLQLALGAVFRLLQINTGIKQLSDTEYGSSLMKKINDSVFSSFKKKERPLTKKEIINKIVKGERRRKAQRHSLTQKSKAAVSKIFEPVVKRVAPVLKGTKLAVKSAVNAYVLISLIREGAYMGSWSYLLFLIQMLIDSHWFKHQVIKMGTDPQSTIERIKITKAILTIATGAYLFAKKTSSLLSAKELSENEIAMSYIQKHCGEDCIRFEKNEREKILYLIHTNTAQVPEVFVEPLRELNRHFDLKTSVISDSKVFAKEVAEAIPYGRLKAVIAQVHGSEYGIQEFGDNRVYEALGQLNKTTSVILQSCSGGYPKIFSPAAKIASRTGLTVIGNAATSSSFNLIFKKPDDPTTAQFTSVFSPWKETTTTFIPESDDSFNERICNLHPRHCVIQKGDVSIVNGTKDRLIVQKPIHFSKEVTILTDKHLKNFPFMQSMERTFSFLTKAIKYIALAIHRE